MTCSVSRTLPLIACASLALASSAFAQAPADTLARIKDTRTITLGVREAARPFSYLNEQKQPVGYSVDLCLAAVEEIKRTLKLPDLKVNYKVVAGAERIPKLESGDIDLECGSTTNTKARQEKVAFSYTIFVAGIRVLAPKGTKIESVKDLSGLPVAVSKGTTSEKLFTQLNASEVKMQLVQFASNGEAYQALKEGKVRAFPQDDSLLVGMASHDNALDRLDLSSVVLSVEPYAIMMRKGDAALAAVVDRTLGRLYAGGEIDAMYRKWFATERLNIQMSRLTRDSFTRPNKESGVAMLLGYSL
jgi:glutamate/aspartate transport system substrate-binding protein